MKRIDPIYALIPGINLFAFSQQVFAHEGHHLDLMTAFLDPLAGWDHLAMVFVFVGLVFLMLRSAVRLVRNRKEMDGRKHS